MVTEVSALAEVRRSRRVVVQRDRTAECIISLDKQQRLSMLAAIPSLQTTFSDGNGGWYLVEIHYGRLAGASTASRSVEMSYIIEFMENSAQTITPDDSLYKGASIGELSIIRKWLQRPEVRIRPAGGEFSYLRLGAGEYLQWAIDTQQARREARHEP